MKKCLCVLILATGLIRQLAFGSTLDAEVSSAIEGTPLTQNTWQITHTEQDQQGISQVWFSSKLGNAALILPRSGYSNDLTTQWGEKLSPLAHQALLLMKSKESQTWVFQRFASEIEITADHLEISYTLEKEKDIDGQYFEMLSTSQLIVGGQYQAQIQTNGKINRVFGSGAGTDEIYGPKEHNTWLIRAGGGGSLQAKSWNSAIEFGGIDTLIGSDEDDDFILVDGVLNATIEGAGGHNQVLFETPLSQKANTERCHNCVMGKSILVTMVKPSHANTKIDAAKPSAPKTTHANVTFSKSDTPVPTSLMGIAALFGLITSLVGQAPLLINSTR